MWTVSGTIESPWRCNRRSTGARIIVNGVRSSWLTFEKNSVFSRSYSVSLSSERFRLRRLRDNCRVRRRTLRSKPVFKSRMVLSFWSSCSTITLNCRARISSSSLPVGCSRSHNCPCSTRFMARTNWATREATLRASTTESVSPISSDAPKIIRMWRCRLASVAAWFCGLATMSSARWLARAPIISPVPAIVSPKHSVMRNCSFETGNWA